MEVSQHIKLSPNMTLIGFSRGSRNTGFVIPELRIMFDAQQPSESAIEHIFVTHGHTDHIFSLPMRICCVPKQPQIYIPKEIVDLTKKFIDATFRLGYNTPDYEHECYLNGVVAGDIIKINQSYQMKVFKLDHNVPCCGYGLQSVKYKLKQEYKNLPKSEILRLKEQNMPLTEQQVDNVFAYLTDTTPSVFLEYPELLTYQHIMTECTFLPIGNVEKTIQIAHEAHHTYWDDLYRIMENNQQVNFLLIHFSHKYTEEEIKKFRDTAALKNVTFVI